MNGLDEGFWLNLIYLLLGAIGRANFGRFALRCFRNATRRTTGYIDVSCACIRICENFPDQMLQFVRIEYFEGFWWIVRNLLCCKELGAIF
jgi:hypothetical protein